MMARCARRSVLLGKLCKSGTIAGLGILSERRPRRPRYSPAMSFIPSNTQIICLTVLVLVIAFYGDFRLFVNSELGVGSTHEDMAAIPVIVCGQTPSIAREVIAGLKPEIEGKASSIENWQ